MDIFKKLDTSKTDLGKYQNLVHGYMTFPKLEGEIGPVMTFQGKKVITWSVNNYLGLANLPEIRKTDAEAAAKWGLAYPMGARMMTGETKYHEKLEQQLADFVSKESGYLLNYGYQGMVSIIDSLVDRNDVIVYDSDSHACILDGSRLHMGKRFVFKHNDMESLDKQLVHATKYLKNKGNDKGGILVITEGVFGMEGDLGNLKGITDLKDKYDFRFFIDDAHGIGTMGETGAGTDEHFGVQDKVDVYFGTFAKAFAGIGAFVAAEKGIIDYLRYTMRSQIFAKSLPMPMVIGAMKRLELLQKNPEYKNKLWTIVNSLQKGLKENGFNLGVTESPVTPVFFEGDDTMVIKITKDLRENYGIFCSAVVYPVIPKGKIMLRLIPTASHEQEHVDKTIAAFSEIQEKLKKGVYDN
ncbi:MAG: aminotransferase class I/II-fold pyridoxal phosphate-dependent enzyme [Bacteroidales bacterium]|nr:aminotransferase class I/II-fold pyridoxal phosphate-dependent enzyme [Bacteroidales bacterium]